MLEKSGCMIVCGCTPEDIVSGLTNNIVYLLKQFAVFVKLSTCTWSQAIAEVLL